MDIKRPLVLKMPHTDSGLRAQLGLNDMSTVFEHVTDPVQAKTKGHEEFAVVPRAVVDLTIRGVEDFELHFKTAGPTVLRQCPLASRSRPDFAPRKLEAPTQELRGEGSRNRSFSAPRRVSRLFGVD